MQPPAPDALLARAEKWEDLSRWDRAELGRALRRLGWTYSEIRLLIPVPKATLSGWCSGIDLSASQVDAIKARTASQAGVPRDTQWRRRQEIQQIRATAAKEVPRAYWGAQLAMPDAYCYKTFVKPDGTGHRKNHLKQGVCEVRARSSTDAFHRVMAWIDHLSNFLSHGDC